jgi:arylsulfatase
VVDFFPRRLISFSAVLLTILALRAPLNSRAAEPKPNIIIILADDLGFSDLCCYGSEIPTPHLDSMARQGLRLTQFYTTPRCCPSRAALMTGLYPQQAGIGAMMEDRGLPGYRGELNRNCITIAEQLQGAGYHTAMVGKWHLSHIWFDGRRQLNHEIEEPFWDNKNGWPLQRGFEEYYGNIHGVCSYFDPFSLVLDNSPVWKPGTNFYYTDSISDRAVADIQKCAPQKKPFFLYVAYTAPHWPLQAPESDIAKYRPRYMEGWDVIRSNRYRRQIELGIIDPKWSLSPRDPRVPDWRNVADKEWEANRMATYAAMIEHLDRGVGRILEALKKTGVDKNTLVIFFSDNGGCAEVIEPAWYDIPNRTRDGRHIKTGNRDHSVFAGPEDVWQSYGVPWANVSDTPFLLYKHFTHEGGIASPFIVRWPAGIKRPGTISRQIAHVTDIMATAVELSGADYPKTFRDRPIQPLEGQSLLPILLDKRHDRSQPIFWEHEGNRAVRQGAWKLVARQKESWELYDTESDRTELHNLAASHADKVAELSALYKAWADRCHVLPFEDLPHELPIEPAHD